MKLTWHRAPIRTEWGAGMVAADIEVTKDTTATIYCEAQDVERVQAMLKSPESPQPAPVAA